MKIIYCCFVTVRLALIGFFFLYFWLARHFQLTSSSAWLPLEVVALFVLIEEVIAGLITGSKYFSDFYAAPAESRLPAIVFESDRTFVEVLCAVAAAILAIVLGGGNLASRQLAKVTLALCVLLCFAYLNLQGASVEKDKDESGDHLVVLLANRSDYLLILRNFIYWTFLYGLAYTVLVPR